MTTVEEAFEQLDHTAYLLSKGRGNSLSYIMSHGNMLETVSKILKKAFKKEIQLDSDKWLFVIDSEQSLNG